ncbi:MAG: inositol monophosphatase [Phycisphaerae bacterium]|nr:inositol monophosphatase [Phycisphaerae bacterium]
MKEFLKRIAVEAGELSLGYREGLSSIRVRQKSAKNLVTEADVAVERFLVQQIRDRFPDHAILAEEGGSLGGIAPYRWIIDPIDGTNSFLHGQPFYSVSIALEKDGHVILGSVYAPVLGELFLAERQGGATLNGTPIRVSAEDTLVDCLLGTGFACLRDNLPRNNLPYLCAVLPKVLDIRRSGSVAIDLCYVACGRLDGFWELNLRPYDIAAGQLILAEAGGRITDFAGGEDHIPDELAASNGRIHKDLVRILCRVDGSEPA